MFRLSLALASPAIEKGVKLCALPNQVSLRASPIDELDSRIVASIVPRAYLVKQRQHSIQ